MRGTSYHYQIELDQIGQKGNFLSNKKWLKDENRLETTPEYTDRINNDLVSSKEAIELKFGKEVYAYSFPYGDYGQKSENIEEAEDIIADQVNKTYKLAFYQSDLNKIHPFNWKEENNFMIKRINMDSERLSGLELVRELEENRNNYKVEYREVICVVQVGPEENDYLKNCMEMYE